VSVQRCGAGVAPAGETLPPGIEKWVDRVRRATAQSRADALDRRALAFTQQGVCGAVDIQ
jgi:hypothetical protein